MEVNFCNRTNKQVTRIFAQEILSNYEVLFFQGIYKHKNFTSSKRAAACGMTFYPKEIEVAII